MMMYNETRMKLTGHAVILKLEYVVWNMSVVVLNVICAFTWIVFAIVAPPGEPD